MRFAVFQDKIVPDKLLLAPAKTYPISLIESLPPQPPLNPDFSYNEQLEQLLIGKQLLLEDLQYPLSELHVHYENGYLHYRKGIIFTKNKPTCVRCGNTEKQFFANFPCARCGESCLYCRKCIMMGRISTCTPLVSWIGPTVISKLKTVPTNNSFLSWNGTLSDGQEAASKKVITAINENEEFLVWAVCGAGKTEVLFQGIDAALTSGKRVCLATPRTDVVLELTPRLKTAFPTVQIASLYGGSEDRMINAPLTIATTHQLLRFYQAFDTVILDEVDAFPYSVDESLQYAVQQALKQTSSIIYLTATPNKKWQAECSTGKRKFTTIPARYHRHPLPVPTLLWCGNWEKTLKKDRLPRSVIQWIKQCLYSEKQCLIFIPKIEKMEKILPIVRRLHPKTEAVHAEDLYRKEKVQAMRNQEIQILLTTTILERGVTFPNIDVAVLGAEDRIFTESALVQIAGRVGRSVQYPSGDITFFHYGKTEAMNEARRQIIRMNKEAKKKGLIDY